MGVVTTRPDDALDWGGVNPEGTGTPGSVVTALSDNDNLTYVAFSHADHLFVGFAEPVIPAGAVVKAGRLRVTARKTSNASGSMLISYRMRDPEASGANVFGHVKQRRVSSTSFTNFTALNDEIVVPHVTPTDIVADMYTSGTQLAPIHVSALYFDTIYVAKPVVTVTSPSGTVTGDTTPTVNWDSTLDDDGGSQKAFQVKLFTSAQANPTAASSTNESGIIEGDGGGASTWTPTLPLADGSWFVYVRTAQTVNGETHWSDWGSGTAGSFSTFTVTIDRPAAPTMVLTSEPASGRIKVLLTSNAGAATTSLFETQVSDDGTNWESLRTALGDGRSTPSGSAATEYDYEAPNGATRHFRARALHAYPEGYAASAWSATQTSSWTSTDFWLKSINTPSLNIAVMPKSQPSATRTGRVGLFQPLAAKYPVAVTDKRGSATGQFVFLLSSDSERDAFEELLDEAGVVLMQAPAGIQDWPDRYCVLGDYGRGRARDSPHTAYSDDSVEWTEVARP